MKRRESHPNMQLRRLLLDGVKIIEPYRHALLARGGMDDRAVLNEAKLMETWVKMARVVSLKLRRAAEGKSE